MHRVLDTFLPPNGLRRAVISKLYHTVVGHAARNPFYSVFNFVEPSNIKMFRQYSGTNIFCNVCGSSTTVFYDFPNVENRTEHRIGLLRETLQCRRCGATMRDRTLAYALLEALNARDPAAAESIYELSDHASLKQRILDTDSFSVMSRLLARHANYVRSSFKPDIPFGVELEKNRYNVNLERINFPNESFDVVLTSDVAEHIRDIDGAHREIFRVLRPGGLYIFTVPYDPNCPSHHVLVDTSEAEDKFLVPKQIHGDPLTGDILAYRVFGRQIFDDLKSIGFSLQFFFVKEPSVGIYGGDVFVASK